MRDSSVDGWMDGLGISAWKQRLDRPKYTKSANPASASRVPMGIGMSGSRRFQVLEVAQIPPPVKDQTRSR